jgi:hypothetical protein
MLLGVDDCGWRLESCWVMNVSVALRSHVQWLQRGLCYHVHCQDLMLVMLQQLLSFLARSPCDLLARISTPDLRVASCADLRVETNHQWCLARQ